MCMVYRIGGWCSPSGQFSFCAPIRVIDRGERRSLCFMMVGEAIDRWFLVIWFMDIALRNREERRSFGGGEKGCEVHLATRKLGMDRGNRKLVHSSTCNLQPAICNLLVR